MKTIWRLSVFLALSTVSAVELTSPVPILKKELNFGPAGSHDYVIETGNGIYEDQQGYQKDPDTHVIQGQVQYVSPEGKLISWRYISDENGYRVEGDHFPKAPAAPA